MWRSLKLLVAVLGGFLAGLYAPILLMAAIAGSTPYEDVLPYALLSGLGLAVFCLYRLTRKASRDGTEL